MEFLERIEYREITKGMVVIFTRLPLEKSTNGLSLYEILEEIIEMHNVSLEASRYMSDDRANDSVYRFYNYKLLEDEFISKTNSLGIIPDANLDQRYNYYKNFIIETKKNKEMKDIETAKQFRHKYGLPSPDSLKPYT